MSSFSNINSTDIKYLNKDFVDFKPADPGTMFMDMAAYVGDVLSVYQESQIQENFLQYAKDKNNLLTMAYMFGYKPKVTTASTTLIDVFQLVPSILSGSSYIPDFDYALIIDEDAVVT